jgi:hypothetical protein
MCQKVLHITIGHTAMLKIQPDTVKTEMGRLFDEGWDVMPKATHANRFAPTNFGERLAFSHETSVMSFSISRVFVNSPGNVSGTLSPKAGVMSNGLLNQSAGTR